ncbi:MAG: lipid-A-disaccharide synthase [Firmicutes bacterium]|nr:lipid-A-disaccharide synthase [Bacillota bacterium]
MGKPVIFFSTCEFSGDMHGEVLIKEIRKKAPEASFYGIGGSRMAEAGMELLFDPTSLSTLGFVEAVKNIRRLKKLIGTAVAEWKKRRPDIIIWLDSWGFNLLLAKEAQKMGIPVVCMFSPSAWAYGQGRAKKMAERVRMLLAVFPFEADFYRKFGIEVHSVGYPLIDRVKNEFEPEEYRKQLGLRSNQKLVALLPGSRRQEILRLLGPMLEAATIIDQAQEVKWVLPKAASVNREELEKIARQYPVDLVIRDGDVYNLLAAADGGVIASGTATLEAALLNTPSVVIYQVSKLSFFIYRRLASAQFKKEMTVASPNLILGRKVYPELLQEKVTGVNIAGHLKSVLNDESYNRQIRRDLKIVRELIGPPGVMERAASLILKEIAK